MELWKEKVLEEVILDSALASSHSPVSLIFFCTLPSIAWPRNKSITVFRMSEPLFIAINYVLRNKRNYSTKIERREERTVEEGVRCLWSFRRRQCVASAWQRVSEARSEPCFCWKNVSLEENLNLNRWFGECSHSPLWVWIHCTHKTCFLLSTFLQSLLFPYI